MERQPSENQGTPEAGRRRAKAYQAAMEAVLAVPIAMGIGWWVDRKLGSEPWGLLVGLGFGFVTFIVRLSRMRGMVETAAAEAERARKARGEEGE